MMRSCASSYSYSYSSTANAATSTLEQEEAHALLAPRVRRLLHDNQPDQAWALIREQHNSDIELADRTLTVAVYNDVMRAFLGANRVNKALEVLGVMQHTECLKHSPDAASFHQLVAWYSANNQIHQAKTMVARMVAARHRPTAATYRPIMKQLCQRGDLDGALLLLNDMRTNVSCDSADLAPAMQPLLELLSRNGEVERVRELVGNVLEPASHTLLVSAYCHRGDVHGARAALDELHPASSSAYALVINEYRKHGDVDGIHQLIDEMLARAIVPPPIVVSHLIGAYCTREQPERAWAVLDEYKAAGYTPSTSMYSQILQSFLHMRSSSKSSKTTEPANSSAHQEPQPPSRGLREFMDLVQREGAMHSNVLLQTQAIRAHCRSEHTIDQALELLRRMQSESDPKLRPNTAAYNAVLRALSDAGRVDDTELVWSEMLASGHCEPDAFSYQAVIRANVRASSLERARRAAALVHEMTSSAYELLPSPSVVALVVHGLCELGQVDTALALVRAPLVQHLVTAGAIHELVKALRASKRPPALAIELLESASRRKGFVSSRPLVNEVLEYVSEVASNMKPVRELLDSCQRRFGIEPDLATYSVVLGGYCRRKQLAEAEALVAELRGTRGLTPDRIIYNQLLCAYIDANEFEQASRVARDMVTAGMPLDAFTYAQIINGFCRRQRFDDAWSVLDSMQPNGVAPTAGCFNMLMRGYLQLEDDANASRTFDTMLERHVAPDTVTFAQLIEHYCLKHRVADALRWYHRMLETPSAYQRPSTASTTGSVHVARLAARVISECYKKPTPTMMKEARTLYDRLLADGVRPSIHVFSAMMQPLARKGNVAAIRELMADMQRFGLRPNNVIYNQLISAFCAVNDTNGARAVVAEMSHASVQPDLCSFVPIIKCHLRSSATKSQVASVLALMKAARVEPDAELAALLSRHHLNANHQ